MSERRAVAYQVSCCMCRGKGRNPVGGSRSSLRIVPSNTSTGTGGSSTIR